MLILKNLFEKILILCVIFLAFPVHANKEESRLNILSVHSYHQDYPWTSSQYNAFKKQISRNLPQYNLNFANEYLDTKHISPSKDYQKTFFNYISAKYNNHLPDIIYVTDDNALNFMTAKNMEFIAEIPIVFSGINNTKFDKSHIKNPLIGVYEYKDIDASISLAVKIQPDLSRIIFLGDGGTTDIAIKNNFIQNNYKKEDIEFIYLSNPNLDILINQLNNIDAGMVILTTIGKLHDNQGVLLDLSKIIEALTKTGKMILTMEDTYLLPGIIGGYVTTGNIQGKTAANILSQFIQNDITNKTTSEYKKTSELILSWPELQSYNIKLKEDFIIQAKIINQPLQENNKNKILVNFLLFIVLLLIIVSLISMFNTRRKSKLLNEQFTDKLTNLPNRIKLLHDINNIDEQSLLIIDINNFKSINNLYGLNIGDKLLHYFGQKAQTYINHEYSLYRAGGNRFAIINNQRKTANEFDAYSLKFLHDIQKTNFNVEKIDIKLTLTAGISRNESEFLIPMAEQALQEAKDKNKDYCICSNRNDNAEQYNKNIVWAHKLNSALSNDRIVPFYQVITHNKTGKDNKFEALIRLIDDNGNVISPFFFLETAKSARQYSSLTRLMIEKTFLAINDRAISISINFTVNDILDHKTIDFFISQLKEFQIAERIIVELTESEDIENYHEVSEFIKEIKKMGCRVAIDDFGTGYANFTHLIHLNVDYLKIDGSIIQNIIKNKNSEITVKVIVDFAQQLGIETIAEFVDSQEILDKVTELGVDYSQGYFLGKPEEQPNYSRHL